MAARPVFDLLPATGPLAQDATHLAAYGQLVGSWDVEAVWYQPDGTRRTGKGEWHFDWILGGTGIQDLLFASGAAPHQYGTTLRCYDKSIDAWHLAWMQPAGGEFVNLLGRRIGNRVVAETQGEEPRRRWSFTEITARSFHWRGEVSHDQGVSWFLEQEMWTVRRTAIDDKP